MKIDDLLLMVYYIVLYTIIMMAKAYHCRTKGESMDWLETARRAVARRFRCLRSF